MEWWVRVPGRGRAAVAPHMTFEEEAERLEIFAAVKKDDKGTKALVTYKPYTSFAWPVLPIRKFDKGSYYPEPDAVGIVIHLGLWIIAAGCGCALYAHPVDDNPSSATIPAPGKLLLASVIATSFTILFALFAFVGTISFVGHEAALLVKSPLTVSCAAIAMAFATCAQLLSTAAFAQGTLLWFLDQLLIIKENKPDSDQPWKATEVHPDNETMDNVLLLGTLAYTFQMMAFMRLLRNCNSYPYLSMVHNIHLLGMAATV